MGAPDDTRRFGQLLTFSHVSRQSFWSLRARGTKIGKPNCDGSAWLRILLYQLGSVSHGHNVTPMFSPPQARATIDEQRLAGNETRRVGSEKRDSRPDFLRTTKAGERDLGEISRLALAA